ncbi:MAG: hypothetical protein VX949_00260 [Planctomycetota bacterium]|nr:hypothetical protein [Planctomycetota bacterium]
MNSATAMVLLLVTLLHPGEMNGRELSIPMLEIAGDSRWGDTRVLDSVSLDGIRGDIHPSLFGLGSSDLSLQWQQAVGEGFIAETVRGVLREHLKNDPEYTTEGYGNEMARINGNMVSARDQQWRVIPSSFTALDLGRIDPLFDTPVMDHSPFTRHLDREYRRSEPIYREHYEILPWPEWGPEGPASMPRLGGIRASYGMDSISPDTGTCIRFQWTVNLERSGDSGFLLQICFEGKTRSP